MDFSKLLHRFVKIDKGGINGFIEVVTWICQNCYIDFSKSLYGFVIFHTWISLSFYMDLPKLILEFLSGVAWICQSSPMYFSPFTK